jgi:hypothetical protein
MVKAPASSAKVTGSSFVRYIFCYFFVNCTFLVGIVLFIFFYIILMLNVHMNVFLQIICELCANLFPVTSYKIRYNHRHERVESFRS